MKTEVATKYLCILRSISKLPYIILFILLDFIKKLFLTIYLLCTYNWAGIITQNIDFLKYPNVTSLNNFLWQSFTDEGDEPPCKLAFLTINEVSHLHLVLTAPKDCSCP